MLRPRRGRGVALLFAQQVPPSTPSHPAVTAVPTSSNHGVCVDIAGWRDTEYRECRNYMSTCTNLTDGGWESKGEAYYAQYATNGVSARTACCDCGGGTGIGETACPAEFPYTVYKKESGSFPIEFLPGKVCWNTADPTNTVACSGWCLKPEYESANPDGHLNRCPGNICSTATTPTPTLHCVTEVGKCTTSSCVCEDADYTKSTLRSRTGGICYICAPGRGAVKDGRRQLPSNWGNLY